MLSRVSLDYCLFLLGACRTGQSQVDILHFYNVATVKNLLDAAGRINKSLESPAIEHITTLDLGRYYETNLPSLLHQYVCINRTKTDDDACLTDIINFKDTWTTPFTLIERMPFCTFEGINTEVQMMRRSDSYLYYKDNHIEAVKLLFTSGAYIELVMGLPQSDEYIGLLEYKICNVKLTLPKFTLHSDTDLKPILVDNGLGGLYDTSRSEGSLSIIKAHQVINFIFNEFGAEVKVKTMLVLRNCSSAPTYTIVNFNRAFHFRMSMNDLVLISGYYNGT